MAELEVTCLTRTNGTDASSILTISGWPHWTYSQAEAIAVIETGEDHFYVTVDGHRVWLTVGRDALGRKYLTTERREGQADALLGLHECWP